MENSEAPGVLGEPDGHNWPDGYLLFADVV